MRKLLMFIICLALTGCRMITFSVDGLLNAPNVADEQSAIYQALIESAGRGITLEYPRSGDYRSAFVLYDIDGDSEDEVLAFYSVSAVADSNVKISVLDRDEDGKWRSRYELAGAGSSVDRVIFLESDAVVGYSSLDYEENTFEMYRFAQHGATSEKIGAVFSCSYTILDKADLDGCGRQELAVVRRSGAGLEFMTLKFRGGKYDSYSLPIDIGTTTVSGYNFGRLGGGQAMYLDTAIESGGLVTEVIGLSDEGIVCYTEQSFGGAALDLQTLRPAGYLSRDYDGDGAVEIPVVELFTGYSAGGDTVEYMTRWLSYDVGGFVQKSNAYYNIRDGYVLTIPNRWLNVVTVQRDSSTGEVTFFKYDTGGEIPEITPIMSFASAESSGGGAYVSAGYSVLLETDFITYYVRTVADPGEPLVLTMDEIKDNFHVIG